MCFHHQVGEFALEPGGAYDVVVNPVVIAAARFAEQDAVIFEAVFVEPILGDFAVRFSAAGEEENDVAFVVPAVEHFQSVGVGEYGTHALWLFVRYVVANGAVYVNEKVFDVFGQYGADSFTFFVERFLQRRVGMFLLYHRVSFTQR